MIPSVAAGQTSTNDVQMPPPRHPDEGISIDRRRHPVERIIRYLLQALKGNFQKNILQNLLNKLPPQTVQFTEDLRHSYVGANINNENLGIQIFTSYLHTFGVILFFGHRVYSDNTTTQMPRVIFVSQFRKPESCATAGRGRHTERGNVLPKRLRDFRLSVLPAVHATSSTFLLRTVEDTTFRGGRRVERRRQKGGERSSEALEQAKKTSPQLTSS